MKQYSFSYNFIFLNYLLFSIPVQTVPYAKKWKLVIRVFHRKLFQSLFFFLNGKIQSSFCKYLNPRKSLKICSMLKIYLEILIFAWNRIYQWIIASENDNEVANGSCLNFYYFSPLIKVTVWVGGTKSYWHQN